MQGEFREQRDRYRKATKTVAVAADAGSASVRLNLGINRTNLENVSAAGDVDVGGPALDIAAGYSHTCALLQSGAMRCWGRGNEGQLGYGNTNNIGDDEPPAAAGDVPVF